ncbi:MAG: segregation/condensation protein A [Deltaproteobacteria bacterium]|nr:segregation/condensation protein A [Deltaproteobacteria bacterium]
MDPACHITIEAFDGPLDLLLHLIHKNQIDIADIPMSLVTTQYLQYLDLMRELNIAIAGEYLAMAATLIHIKSRMLLPRPEPPMDMTDPREELVRPLQDLARFKEAASALESRNLLNRDVFVRTGAFRELLAEMGEDFAVGVKEIGVFELFTAFKNAMARQNGVHVLELDKEGTNLPSHMALLSGILAQRRKEFFLQLVMGQGRNLIILTFLAILELTKMGKLLLLQKDGEEDILIYWVPINQPHEIPDAGHPHDRTPALAGGHEVWREFVNPV